MQSKLRPSCEWSHELNVLHWLSSGTLVMMFALNLVPWPPVETERDEKKERERELSG